VLPPLQENASTPPNLSGRHREAIQVRTATLIVLLVPLLLGTGLLGWCQEGSVEFRDDFSSYAAGSDGSPRWLTHSIFWEARDGAYAFDGRSPGFAVAGEGPSFRKVVVEATMDLRESHGDSWKVAGIAVYADSGNFWHLALVESPQAAGARHYVELSEMLKGEWLSQNTLRQTAREGPAEDAWQLDTPYRLRIEMSPGGILGTIADGQGQVIHRIGYAFSAEAVTAGRAALRTSMFSGAFDDVEVSMSDPVPTPARAAAPPFAVAASDDVIGEAKGFYYVKEIDGVWWVVDPRGRRFYAVGTDHCRMGGHWCEKLGYAPYGRNMQAKFDSPAAWAESATDRLKVWNFNLLGAGGGEEAFYRGLAHTRFVAFGSSFSDVSDICPKTTWTGFPNVFHPKWEQYCDKMARTACESHRDDPWLFGYFLDNELEWYGKTGRVWGLFAEAMKKRRDHSAKVALVDFLRDRYRTIERFNEVWRTKLGSFDELLDLDALDASPPEAQKAAIDFVRLVADRYFAVTTAAIRKHDPNHMVIGCRFAGDAPAGIWDIAGKYCDIVTFNYYGRVDLETGEAPGLAERFTDYFRQAKRPMMITEWSFPALDSGLPCKHGAGERFDTQAQRAQAYEIFQRMVFSLPFMVGSDYFMWVDEPAQGISSTFPEDSNYGLVNEKDEPWPELTQTATRVNALCYDLHAQGMADMAVGEVRVGDDGFSAPILNKANRPVEVEVLVAIDGRESRRTLQLPAKGREELRIAQKWEPGGHLVVVQVDPDRKVSQVTRADDRASLAFYRPGLPWAESAPKGTQRIPLVVGNGGPDPVANMPITRRLRDLAPLAWDKTDWSQVYLYGAANGQSVVCQIDPYRQPLTPDSELSFVVPALAPGACETYFVTILPVAQERREPPSPFAYRPMNEGEFSLRNETADPPPLVVARYEAPGCIFDGISVNGVPLGSYNPLIWQFPGQNQWVRTNVGGPVEASVGPVRARLRITAAYQPDAGGRPITTVDDTGRQAAAMGGPVPFRVTHEVVVYPQRPWFHARFVSIENTGDRPLQVNGYFFYLNASIGGSPAGDAPATPDVPNYYGGGQDAWRDTQVGAVFGAEPWPGSDLKVNFFLDEGGMQHPDARKQFETPIVLQPGETYTEPDAPFLTVYGASAQDSPWQLVRRCLEAWGGAAVQPGKVEKR
jgi:hypothetical protein